MDNREIIEKLSKNYRWFLSIIVWIGLSDHIIDWIGYRYRLPDYTSIGLDYQLDWIGLATLTDTHSQLKCVSQIYISSKRIKLSNSFGIANIHLRNFWEGYDLYIRCPILVSSTTKTAATTLHIVTKAENKTKIPLDHQLDRFNQNIRVAIQVKYVQKVLTYDTLSCIININKPADIFATRKIKH